MATVYYPPPNSLMLRGEADAIALHGKKLSVFPDWYWATRKTDVVLTGKWGALDYSKAGSVTDRWRHPWEKEPEAVQDSMSKLYVELQPAYLVSRRRNEGESEFDARVAVCESEFGVSFVNDGDDAMAEVPGEFASKQIIKGYYVALNWIDRDERKTAYEAISKKYGVGDYAIAVALKLNGNRIRMDESTHMTKDVFFDYFNYSESENTTRPIRIAGIAIYKYGENRPLRLQLDKSLKVIVSASYYVVGTPPLYTYSMLNVEVTSSSNSDLGVFNGLVGGPTIESKVVK